MTQSYVADGTVLTRPLPLTNFPSTTLIRLFELLKNTAFSTKTNLKLNALGLCSLLAAWISLMTGSWWRMTGSNRRPPACKAGALPAELIPHSLDHSQERLVGLVGFEPTTPALSRRCSNRLSYRPTHLFGAAQRLASSASPGSRTPT